MSYKEISTITLSYFTSICEKENDAERYAEGKTTNQGEDYFSSSRSSEKISLPLLRVPFLMLRGKKKKEELPSFSLEEGKLEGRSRVSEIRLFCSPMSSEPISASGRKRLAAPSEKSTGGCFWTRAKRDRQALVVFVAAGGGARQQARKKKKPFLGSERPKSQSSVWPSARKRFLLGVADRHRVVGPKRRVTLRKEKKRKLAHRKKACARRRDRDQRDCEPGVLGKIVLFEGRETVGPGTTQGEGNLDMQIKDPAGPVTVVEQQSA